MKFKDKLLNGLEIYGNALKMPLSSEDYIKAQYPGYQMPEYLQIYHTLCGLGYHKLAEKSMWVKAMPLPEKVDFLSDLVESYRLTE